MQLDINISWPSFMAYDSSVDPLNPRPFKFGDFPRAAERYYSPSARDFVAVYARAAVAPGTGAGTAGSTGAAASCTRSDGGERRGVPATGGTHPTAC
jgi:hypothetical protein